MKQNSKLVHKRSLGFSGQGSEQTELSKTGSSVSKHFGALLTLGRVDLLGAPQIACAKAWVHGGIFSVMQITRARITVFRTDTILLHKSVLRFQFCVVLRAIPPRNANLARFYEIQMFLH